MRWGAKRHTVVIKIHTRRGVTKMHTTCLIDGLTHRDKHTQKDVHIEVMPILSSMSKVVVEEQFNALIFRLVSFQGMVSVLWMVIVLGMVTVLGKVTLLRMVTVQGWMTILRMVIIPSIVIVHGKVRVLCMVNIIG